MLLAEADYQNTLTFPDGEKINASGKPEHAGHQEDRLACDGEWFAFYPGKSGFTFADYERERDWAGDCPEDTHMVAEIWSTVLNGTPERVFVVYSSLIGHGKTEIWRGTISEGFDTEMIDTSVFPGTLEDIMACCEPNG